MNEPVLRCTGDIAEVLGGSMERLEERIDAAESRIQSRLSELEDGIHARAVDSAN